MSTVSTPKSWQARIGEATDAIAQTFVESMSYDWRPINLACFGLGTESE